MSVVWHVEAGTRGGGALAVASGPRGVSLAQFADATSSHGFVSLPTPESAARPDSVSSSLCSENDVKLIKHLDNFLFLLRGASKESKFRPS